MHSLLFPIGQVLVVVNVLTGTTSFMQGKRTTVNEGVFVHEDHTILIMRGGYSFLGMRIRVGRAVLFSVVVVFRRVMGLRGAGCQCFLKDR